MKHSLFSFAAVLLLTACTAQPEPIIPNEDAAAISSESLSSEMAVEVSYMGVLEDAGISIYQEGTHRLLTEDNQLVLLESGSVDLSLYVGQKVMIQGMERATVEAGGRILDVLTITSMDAEMPSSMDSSSSEVSSSVASLPSATVSSTAPIVSSAPVTAVSSVPTDDPVQMRIAAMAAFKMDSWTQQYCSQHVGFCFPVQKNAWYKSFGATTSSLWHVELSSEDILTLGDGPVSVTLLSGAAGNDGMVRTEGSTVIGERAWTENRHFEIKGPVELRSIVEYITNNLTASSES